MTKVLPAGGQTATDAALRAGHVTPLALHVIVNPCLASVR